MENIQKNATTLLDFISWVVVNVLIAWEHDYKSTKNTQF